MFLFSRALCGPHISYVYNYYMGSVCFLVSIWSLIYVSVEVRGFLCHIFDFRGIRVLYYINELFRFFVLFLCHCSRGRLIFLFICQHFYFLCKYSFLSVKKFKIKHLLSFVFCFVPMVTVASFLIYCNNFTGVTLKEKDSNSGGTLVDVGLSKVWAYHIIIYLALS